MKPTFSFSIFRLRCAQGAAGWVSGLLLFSMAFFGATQAFAGSKIRVLSFNLRKIDESDGENIWYKRRMAVMEYMHDVHADLIGLQEAHYEMMQDVIASMKDYDHVGQGRDGGENGEYTPIFFLRAKYTLVRSGTFWLSETPDVVSNTWGVERTRIMTWAILENKATKERFLYANTHFDHQSSDSRKNSSRLVKRRLQEYANGLPIIVSGDFNCRPTATAYTRMINTDGTFPMEEAWRDGRVTVGPNYTFHNWGKKPLAERGRLDYIFVTPNIRTLKAVTDDETKRPRYLSDHVPIYADLELP